jgi:hypothetical protein
VTVFDIQRGKEYNRKVEMMQFTLRMLPDKHPLDLSGNKRGLGFYD